MKGPGFYSCSEVYEGGEPMLCELLLTVMPWKSDRSNGAREVTTSRRQQTLGATNVESLGFDFIDGDPLSYTLFTLDALRRR